VNSVSMMKSSLHVNLEVGYKQKQIKYTSLYKKNSTITI